MHKGCPSKRREKNEVPENGQVLAGLHVEQCIVSSLQKSFNKTAYAALWKGTKTDD